MVVLVVVGVVLSSQRMTEPIIMKPPNAPPLCSADFPVALSSPVKKISQGEINGKEEG